MTNNRHYSRADQLIIGVGRVLQTLFARPRSIRSYPAASRDDENMSARNRTESGRYMRVNHVGEVCAQALYQSQALISKNESIRRQMRQAAKEEIDHLAWCEQRLDELGGRKSLLNPLWYAGAFAVGVAAAAAGDKWNLGFVAETEKQVVDHLDGHLGELPVADIRSKEVIAQMRKDEARHADQAVTAGAEELPGPIKNLMRFAAKIMTRTAYWV